MPLVAAEDLQGEFEGNGCLCSPKCVTLTIEPACGGGLCNAFMGLPVYACNCGSFYCVCGRDPFVTPDKDHFNHACIPGVGFTRKGVADTGAPTGPEMER